MKILNQRMTVKKFISYIDEMKIYPWTRKIDKIVLHHTSSPVESWQNSGSMLHYWNLYRSRGWKSGPHIFIAPNGVWMFTPIKKQGTCSCLPLNKGSIHIEVVGRYFDAYPSEEIEYITAVVIEKLRRKFQKKDGICPGITNHFVHDPESNCTPLLNYPWYESIRRKHCEVLKNLGLE